MNKKQLEESIRFTYGSNIDAHTYLQKFLTLEATLPKRSESRNNDIEIYCKNLYERHEMSGLDKTFIPLASTLANHFNLTLRQLEKVFSNIALSLSSFNSPSEITAEILLLLCTIKTINPSLFARLAKGQISYNELAKEINYDKDKCAYQLVHIMLWANYCLIPENELKKLPETDPLRKLDDSMWGNFQKEILAQHISALTNFSIK